MQVEVQATTGSTGDPFLLGQLKERAKKVRIFTPDGQQGRAEASAVLVYANKRGRSMMLEAQASTGLPRNGRLVMDYSKWSPKKPRGIRAFVTARQQDARATADRQESRLIDG